MNLCIVRCNFGARNEKGNLFQRNSKTCIGVGVDTVLTTIAEISVCKYCFRDDFFSENEVEKFLKEETDFKKFRVISTYMCTKTEKELYVVKFGDMVGTKKEKSFIFFRPENNLNVKWILVEENGKQKYFILDTDLESVNYEISF
ncbi:MAG: hypothetical protein RsTaC01_0205 [Candidatus Paraimprobicoccus trichonymphae]|uniref:Uncharacterized protein n=1 Tax=Candidatus Paraimprobicoccus trichonymphae TaxID=3033793 RepID=A0AA48KZ25_9FIRM|nr:MAG: hypothetical protein RsTaC01_0205 [Candidatus Paraimprobicoccus trichonymphae]